ncbi:DUF3122 domain-containing protein [Baaleninema simplex]|uniref:DUF3122 domain-containing protein n=1 Tax=Baaleninema simplex TaxID=2862350 RepID=UPI001181B916|nr:DUF3122 domain-containing protein [Baaleninema simplex]
MLDFRPMFRGFDVSRRPSPWQVLLLLLCCWGLWWGSGLPARAAIETYPDPARGEIVVRSLQSLRDIRDGSWQLVLFERRTPTELQGIFLRVVGFPGRRIDRDVPLQVDAATGRSWQVRDRSASASTDEPLPSNIVQYDFEAIARQLSTDTALRLSFSVLGDRRPVEIPVPPFVVREWRTLLFEIAPSVDPQF